MNYQEEYKDNELFLSDSIEKGIILINETVKAVVITSGSLGKALVPKI